MGAEGYHKQGYSGGRRVSRDMPRLEFQSFVGDFLFISVLLHEGLTTIIVIFCCLLAWSDINLDYVTHNFIIIGAV